MYGSHRQNSWIWRALILLLLGIIGFVVYRHHAWTEEELNKSEADLQKCRQKEDSLSAQLQVVYEHKGRVEKSLEKKKVEWKEERTKLNGQLQTVQDGCTKEKEDLQAEVESLKQKGKLSETKQEELEQQYFSVKEEVRRLRESKEEDAKKFQDRITSLDLQISRVQSELTSAQSKMQELSRENENLQDSLKQCNKNAGAERKAVPDAKLSSNEETAKQRSLSLTHTAIAQKSSKLPSQLTTEQQETSSSSTKLLPKSLDEDAEAGQIQKPVPDGGVGIVPNRDQELEANVQVPIPKHKEERSERESSKVSVVEHEKREVAKVAEVAADLNNDNQMEERAEAGEKVEEGEEDAVDVPKKQRFRPRNKPKFDEEWQ